MKTIDFKLRTLLLALTLLTAGAPPSAAPATAGPGGCASAPGWTLDDDRRATA